MLTLICTTLISIPDRTQDVLLIVTKLVAMHFMNVHTTWTSIYSYLHAVVWSSLPCGVDANVGCAEDVHVIVFSS